VLLVKLEGLDSREVAAELLHEPIMVNVADVPDLSEDAYYHYQLLDMRVFDTRGPELGVLTEVIETGSNDVYVVTGENSELMVPALANVIVEVDVEGGRMVVDLPEGIEPRPLRPPKRKHRSRVAKRRKRPHVGLRGELV
jgi:16S rRNA processing protein RimM